MRVKNKKRYSSVNDLQLIYFVRNPKMVTPLLLSIVIFGVAICPIFFFVITYFWLTPVKLGNALYLSATTFLPIGFGGVTPESIIQKIFAVFEGFAGYLYLGLLITTFPKIIGSDSEVMEINNQNLDEEFDGSVSKEDK